MDPVKYDRQIRLFGIETQSKLAGLRVQILGPANFSSCEILKNVVLLGIGKVIVQRDILDHTKRLVPDDLMDINEDLVIELSDERRESEFLFCVDRSIEDDSTNRGNVYFVCSKCLTIKTDGFAHECSDVENTDSIDLSCVVARQCLVGGFAVQEFIKLIQGKQHADCYRVEL